MSDTYYHNSLHPWDSIFPEASRRDYRAGEDITTAGDEVDVIYLVEQGAVVETRMDSGSASHAVNLSGPGSLIGLRMTASGGGIHEVRATALAPTKLRALPREAFLQYSMKRTDLAAAVMHDLARRTEIARSLSDSCNCASTGKHVLAVLSVVLQTFGSEADGSSVVSVPPALLERMTGCPWLMIRPALTDLQSQGAVAYTSSGVRALSMVS